MSNDMNAPEIVAHVGNTLGIEYIPKYSAQCSAVKRMLDRGFTDTQIIDTYMEVKGEVFWQDKFLSFIYLDKNIESKIGTPDPEKDWDKWAEEHGRINDSA